MGSANIVPWWQAISIRAEVVNASGQIDDVQMSLYGTVYEARDLRPAYADPTYYGKITYPTRVLVDLLAGVAVRLGGGNDYLKGGNALKRPDQGMGGGKSHALVGAYHLGANPSAIAESDLGRAILERAREIIGRELPANLNAPLVVVLPCDSMTPGAPDESIDGPARNLYERFLWRLFSKDYEKYERYKPFFNNKAKMAEALRSLGRPVLILIDEIMNYMGNASDGNSVLAGQDLEFLRALTDVIDGVPNVVGLIVMISSEKDPMAQSAAARDRRTDINALLERNGSRAPVTENADFAAILRRRLFDGIDSEAADRTAAMYLPILRDPAWTKQVWTATGGTWAGRFEEEVSRCYPFHPQLMQLAEEEWAEVSGFQRVRSTIRIFAATVYALQQRARSGQWAPLLIGPGDLPLSDTSVREALLDSGLLADERSVSNYRSLAENEIINLDQTKGAARTLDLKRGPVMWGTANPRAAERAATLIFLSSIVGHRPGGRRGASASEAKAATVVPDSAYLLADADGVIEDLVNPDGGMSAVEVVAGQGNNKPARYFLSTRLTHRMLVNNLRKAVTDAERDRVVARFAEVLSNSGPFRKKVFIPADLNRPSRDVLATAGIDDARTTRLVILDPAQFSLRNGMEEETLRALSVAVGLGDGSGRLPVEWASSAVYAIADTQRRTFARGLATEYLARERALATPEVQGDEDLKSTGLSQLAEAKSNLEKHVRRTFQHVVFLAQPDPVGDRVLDQIVFDSDTQTALDGTQVWKALVERGKAFDSGLFSAKALDHNLREDDYNRPLSEIRDAFWGAPRLPLLHGGERDLQQAIYDATVAGLMGIVDAALMPVAVTTPGQVNLASNSLRLMRAAALEGQTSTGSIALGTPSDAHVGGAEAKAGGLPGREVNGAEKYVQFTLVGSLLGDHEKTEGLARLFRALYTNFDEGKVTFAQGTIQLVLDAQSAESIARAARAIGLNTNIRDQS